MYDVLPYTREFFCYRLLLEDGFNVVFGNHDEDIVNRGFAGRTVTLSVGHVDGKVTLECDRCLNKYEYILDFDIDETYAKHSLHDEYSQEVELQSGQFITDLNGAKEIDIYDLLYQSVILQLPNKKVCGINCNEGLFVSDEDMEIHDDRMDVFKNIQINPK